MKRNTALFIGLLALLIVQFSTVLAAGKNSAKKAKETNVSTLISEVAFAGSTQEALKFQVKVSGAEGDFRIIIEDQSGNQYFDRMVDGSKNYDVVFKVPYNEDMRSVVFKISQQKTTRKHRFSVDADTQTILTASVQQ
jgi:hypothetical protein